MHLPTSPAMPARFGGSGRNGIDFDLFAIEMTVFEFLDGTCPPMKAEAESTAVRPMTI